MLLVCVCLCVCACVCVLVCVCVCVLVRVVSCEISILVHANDGNTDLVVCISSDNNSTYTTCWKEDAILFFRRGNTCTEYITNSLSGATNPHTPHLNVVGVCSVYQ